MNRPPPPGASRPGPGQDREQSEQDREQSEQDRDQPEQYRDQPGQDRRDQHARRDPPLFPEFHDEEPGAYLSELGTRTASIVWGAVNLAGTLALGALGAARAIPRDSDWRLLAEVGWALLPLSAAILVITTLWQAATGYTRTPPRKALASFLLGIASLVLWLVFRQGFGALG